MSLINIGYDSSGNGNNWTANNLDNDTASVNTDVMVDVPTRWGTDTGVGGEVRGNYCTWNSAAQSTVVNGTVTRSNGNLQSTDGSTTYGLASFGTIAVSSGKWYWEIVTSAAGGTTGNIGVVLLSSISGSTHSGQFYQMAGYLNPAAYNTNTSAYGASYTVGDVIGVALDMDAGTVTFYKNGTSQGQAASGLSGYYSPAVGDGQNAASYTFVANFGQRPFAYTAPSGFAALCTTNLEDPAIADGSTVFDILTWSGDGNTTRTIATGQSGVSGSVDFTPDFTWIKQRNLLIGHTLYDVVRGTGSLKALATNNTQPESGINADSTYGYLNSFTTNGFDVARGSNGTTSYTNASTGTYVAWNWKAGGTGVANGDGTINSTVSANPSAGFSVVTWVGTGTNSTVGHGLSTIGAPKFIIVKNRDALTNWRIAQTIIPGSTCADGNGYYLELDSTSGVSNPGSATQWGSPPAAPTNTVFSVGTLSPVNGSTNNMVAYCFVPIPGYSAMGTYQGNAALNGSFIYTGFRPRFILHKAYNTTSQWLMWDTERNKYNVLTNAELWANSANQEGAGAWGVQLDILSNGFKFRGYDNTNFNYSSINYIYMAFAENPFKYALAR